jgi:hypothetical protein
MQKNLSANTPSYDSSYSHLASSGVYSWFGEVGNEVVRDSIAAIRRTQIINQTVRLSRKLMNSRRVERSLYGEHDHGPVCFTFAYQ